jgi:3-isopropylmalate dehydrogenase
MMLKYSLNLPVEATAVEEAVRRTIDAGVRTKDIAGKGASKFVSTTEMGDAVAAELLKVLKEIK